MTKIKHLIEQSGIALWDFNIFESVPACQSETIQVFHITDTVLIDEFYTMMLNLLPPDEFY